MIGRRKADQSAGLAHEKGRLQVMVIDAVDQPVDDCSG
jgi:hypothetical protein